MHLSPTAQLGYLSFKVCMLNCVLKSDLSQTIQTFYQLRVLCMVNLGKCNKILMQL